MKKWTPKLTNKYTAAPLKYVADCLKIKTGINLQKLDSYDINSILEYYVRMDCLTVPFEYNALYIPYRVPVITECYRNEVISSDTTNSLIFNYLDNYEDSLYVAFDIAGKHKDSLYFFEWVSGEKNNIKTWITQSDQNNLSIAIKSHGKRKLILSHYSAFTRICT